MGMKYFFFRNMKRVFLYNKTGHGTFVDDQMIINFVLVHSNHVKVTHINQNLGHNILHKDGSSRKGM